MAKPKLAVVIGSIRPTGSPTIPRNGSRRSPRQSGEFDVELVDLKDYPLPFFAEAGSPLMRRPRTRSRSAGSRKMAAFDAYVFTAAEYNRGPAAVLKNALDYAYKEWSNKPVSFVGYGGVGGARAVEQLRLNAIELQMAPIRHGRPHPAAGLSVPSSRKARS